MNPFPHQLDPSLNCYLFLVKKKSQKIFNSTVYLNLIKCKYLLRICREGSIEIYCNQVFCIWRWLISLCCYVEFALHAGEFNLFIQRYRQQEFELRLRCCWCQWLLCRWALMMTNETQQPRLWILTLMEMLASYLMEWIHPGEAFTPTLSL